MSTERPDLDAIEALLTAATPGPWLADLDIFDPDDHEIEACVSSADVRILFTSGTGYTYGEAPEVERAAAWAAAKASQQMTDARLIAAAPTALRSLLTYARALEQDLRTLRGYIDAHADGSIVGAVFRLRSAMNPEDNDRIERFWRSFAGTRAEFGAMRERVAILEQECDAAKARHDAEIAGIVQMLRDCAKDAEDYAGQGARELTRAADSIATTHAAALARHAGRAGGFNG